VDFETMTNFASARLVLLSLFVVAFPLCFVSSSSPSTTTSTTVEDTKSRRICSVQSGLELTRLTSIVARNVFQGAIDDVEQMREYMTEAMVYGGGPVNGFDTLDALAATLDWEARGFKQPTNSVEAGLGWTDDRADRRVELVVATINEPLVGNKEADMKMCETLSSLLPWIVDRKSLERLWWLTDHQNGRSEGDAKQAFRFEQLYTAAWITTYGEAVLYYPPFSVFGHLLNLGDVIGPLVDSHEAVFVAPNLPENDPARKAKFSAPYPDIAVPGLALITAMAPVYYRGEWQNFTYDDVYVATVGIDIKIEAVTSLLSELEGTLTKGSFAFLVDSALHMIVISPLTVGKIYPSRTGFEESRVTYDLVHAGVIVEDRRNQTYLPSDTILQHLTNLTNADWKGLQSKILALVPGAQGFDQINVTLTGEIDPILFHVMYERWDSIDDLVLISLAPVSEVENAIDVRFLEPDSVDVRLDENIENRHPLRNSVTFANDGTLDVMVSLVDLPSWIKLVQVAPDQQVVKAGETLAIEFDILVEELEPGTSNKRVTLNVEDAYYQDCTFSQNMGFEVTVELVSRTSWFDTIGVLQGLVLAVAAILIIALSGFVFKKHNRDDVVWHVQKKDLLFDDPPEIIGRGTFGLILKAEYRGTQVAVKRIMPPKTGPSRGGVNGLGCRFSSAFIEDAESGDGPTSRTLGFNALSFDSSLMGKKISPAAKWKRLRTDFIEEMRYISKLRHPCVTTVMGTSLSFMFVAFTVFFSVLETF
jgi:hypothetical protein